eukprot:scaffold4223_cov189-Amphora_coffeaeformis.AAC.7
MSVATLQEHVRGLLARTNSMIQSENHGKEAHDAKHKKTFFMNILRRVCQNDPQLLEQSALEMLLAGTDTSSVTAYYTLLGLAGDAALQQDLRQQLLLMDAQQKQTSSESAYTTRAPPPT